VERRRGLATVGLDIHPNQPIDVVAVGKILMEKAQPRPGAIEIDLVYVGIVVISLLGLLFDALFMRGRRYRYLQPIPSDVESGAFLVGSAEPPAGNPPPPGVVTKRRAFRLDWYELQPTRGRQSRV
jgi:hypothetical protein